MFLRSDFSEVSSLPSRANIEAADDEGYTVAVGVGLLGVVIYKIVAGTG